MVALANGPINQRKVAVGRHAKQTLSIACVFPDGTNLPFNPLRFVELLPLVFGNQYAPVSQHRNEVGVKLGVGQLKPERRLLPVHVADPVTDILMPVEMDSTFAFFATVKITKKRKVVFFGNYSPLIPGYSHARRYFRI